MPPAQQQPHRCTHPGNVRSALAGLGVVLHDDQAHQHPAPRVPPAPAASASRQQPDPPACLLEPPPTHPHPHPHPTHTHNAGVPIVWHDNYVVFGAEAAPTSRLIAELTAEEFRQLAPINATSAATLGGGAAAAGGEEGRGDADEELLGSSPTFSTASTFSLASLDSAFSGMSGGSTLSLGGMSAASSSSALSGGSSGARRLLRKHRNGEPAVAHEPTLRPWACEVEDHFPTLAEVGGWVGFLVRAQVEAAAALAGFAWLAGFGLLAGCAWLA